MTPSSTEMTKGVRDHAIIMAMSGPVYFQKKKNAAEANPIPCA
jgi:hypothetical protein